MNSWFLELCSLLSLSIFPPRHRKRGHLVGNCSTRQPLFCEFFIWRKLLIYPPSCGYFCNRARKYVFFLEMGSRFGLFSLESSVADATKSRPPGSPPRVSREPQRNTRAATLPVDGIRKVLVPRQPPSPPPNIARWDWHPGRQPWEDFFKKYSNERSKEQNNGKILGSKKVSMTPRRWARICRSSESWATWLWGRKDTVGTRFLLWAIGPSTLKKRSRGNSWAPTD